jgi:hypothetical protein
MDTVAGLIILSSLGAWLCVKARAAGPAAFFSIVAVVLFCTTPLGSAIPGALSSVSHGVADVGGQLASQGGAR